MSIKILKQSDFRLESLPAETMQSSSKGTNFLGEEWIIKRGPATNSFLYQFAIPRQLTLKDLQDDQQTNAYRSLHSLWEVFFSQVAKAIFPENVAEYQPFVSEGLEICAASKVVKGKDGDRIIADRELNGKVDGLYKVNELRRFLGDNDDTGIWPIKNNMFVKTDSGLKAVAIDFQLCSFFKTLPTERTEFSHLSYAAPTHPGIPPHHLLEHLTIDPNEPKEAKKQIANFDFKKIEAIWKEMKPMFLFFSSLIEDGIEKAKTTEFIQKDFPLQVLKERQEWYKAQAKGEDYNLDNGFEEFMFGQDWASKIRLQEQEKSQRKNER